MCSAQSRVVCCRTGLTALTVSLWFFVSLFFGPVLCKFRNPPHHFRNLISHRRMPNAHSVGPLSLPASSSVVASCVPCASELVSRHYSVPKT